MKEFREQKKKVIFRYLNAKLVWLKVLFLTFASIKKTLFFCVVEKNESHMFDYNKDFFPSLSSRLVQNNTNRWWRANPSERCWWSPSNGECFQTKVFSKESKLRDWCSKLLESSMKARSTPTQEIDLIKTLSWLETTTRICISSWRMSKIAFGTVDSIFLWVIFIINQ